VSISERRKSRVETPPIVSKSRRTQRRPVEAAMLHGHPLRVKATKLPRRRFLHLAAGAAALPAASRIAIAQAYPSRPITLIVPLAAGGALDAIARVLAERMRPSLGQPVIIANVTGADGNIAKGRTVRARPDGYTIEIGFRGTHVMNGGFYSLPYDLVNDFAPISPVFTTPLVFFAKETMPANDLRELIAWLKANPNKASAAVYSAEGRLGAAFFQKETGTQFAMVPYRGGAPAVQDPVAGHVDLYLFGTPANLEVARAGSIKAYAVTSDTRLAFAPDIPTVSEMGPPALTDSSWTGFFAPKGTPRDIIDKLNAAVVETLAEAGARSRIGALGFEIFPREQQTPEFLGDLQKADIAKWWPIIKEFGIRAE
jgi:tripartite-type tricarboxylate transporter receptor subunit TctC